MLECLNKIKPTGFQVAPLFYNLQARSSHPNKGGTISAALSNKTYNSSISALCRAAAHVFSFVRVRTTTRGNCLSCSYTTSSTVLLWLPLSTPHCDYPYLSYTDYRCLPRTVTATTCPTLTTSTYPTLWLPYQPHTVTTCTYPTLWLPIPTPYLPDTVTTYTYPLPTRHCDYLYLPPTYPTLSLPIPTPYLADTVTTYTYPLPTRHCGYLYLPPT